MGNKQPIGQHDLVLLLVVLRLGEGAYGVPIAREIAKLAGSSMALSRVYSSLDRLQAKGLVAARLGEPTAVRGGRAKTYFRLTAAGVREARDARRTLERLWTGIPQLQQAVRT